MALSSSGWVSFAQAQVPARPPDASEARLVPPAPDAPRPDAPPADEVQRPEPLGPIEPAYPSETSPEPAEGTVGLELTIDAEGNVTQAVVVESLSPAWDEAVRAAALEARFRPARRGEASVASRIRMRIPIRQRPPQAPSVPHEAAAARPEASRLTAPPAAATGRDPTVEITVQGLTAAERLRQSAESVTVVETERSQRESADLGELLARTQGVGVRRAGGLGSGTRFSLNGLTDDQVRFFLDGVPLEMSGYPFGIANVPVNLVERIEIYSGAVPVRFGADALGGAVNLVTSQDVRGTHASASYEVGSFETHRLTLGGRHLHQPSGFLTRVSGFFDYAKNDYPIDVMVPDERGRLSSARIYRSHDAYRAVGGNVEIGFVNRRWARRLLLRAFVTDYDKEYQHNVVMSVPYGAVTYGERSAGASLRYQQSLGRGVSLDVLGGYAHLKGRFVDVTTCVYDWFGRCGRMRTQPGESDSRPYDQRGWDHSGFARVNATWRAHPQHTLRLALAATYLTRNGDDLLPSAPGARDPLKAERKLWSLVNGVEYELDLLDDRLENIAFAKQFLQILDSEEPRPGGSFRRRDRDTDRFGVGDALRYRFTDWLYAKVSYEYATRLPRPEELFGDNRFIVANLELQPEKSHNGNVGVSIDLRSTRAGAFRAGVNGFLREADQLIVLLGNERDQSYQNVFGARSLGVESTAGWTSPGDYLALDGNLTYQDFRNTADAGAFGDYAGDRIPNRPYFFGFAAARLQFSGVVSALDEVSLFWNSRYVHHHFRAWESVGLAETKQVIPTQLVHGVGLGYLVHDQQTRLSTSAEMQNVTDETVFDFMGVQRPGRAFYMKITAEL
jgi:vitamin B12 transporter